jgi:hypothetical protein
MEYLHIPKIQFWFILKKPRNEKMVHKFYDRLLRSLLVLSPPATEKIGAMGREIESRLGIGW